MTGARDHLTHRIRARLGSGEAAVAAIAATQLLVSGAIVTLALTAPGAAFAFALVAAVCAVWAIRRLDDPAWASGRATAAAPVLPGREIAPASER